MIVWHFGFVFFFHTNVVVCNTFVSLYRACVFNIHNEQHLIADPWFSRNMQHSTPHLPLLSLPHSKHRCMLREARRASPTKLATADTSSSLIGALSQVFDVLGCQWGNEGKGKLVDILAQHFEIVARC